MVPGASAATVSAIEGLGFRISSVVGTLLPSAMRRKPSKENKIVGEVGAPEGRRLNGAGGERGADGGRGDSVGDQGF